MLTFGEIQRILENPRTYRTDAGVFLLDGAVYYIDPMDLFAYQEGCMRKLSEVVLQ